MAQLLIMYKQPADPAAFDDYYFSTHVPIFAKTPGIRGTMFSKGPVTPIAGTASYYLIAAVDFDSMEALQAGLASAPAQAAVADLPNFAASGVDILIYDTR
jgi:uncharacterized protein (TIGR02118 family)